MKKVAILLSAYNGNDYIEEQIESIYSQTYKNFQLYVRDDGSENHFLEKLKQLQQRYNFELITGKNLGFVKSFMCLLDYVNDADLYAFADQDDIWMEDKLQSAVDWFEQQEETESIPLLYHSAYDIIDNQGNVIGHFYFPNAGYDFRRSITENHYSGFSMVINATLREYMLKGDRDNIGYHDWWAAMIVQAFGKGWSDERVTALHRAHGDNVTTFNIKTRVKWLMNSLCIDSDIKTRSKEFFRCFGKNLADNNRELVEKFARKGWHPKDVLWKAFYPKRWRPVMSSELVIRALMLLGRI